MNIKNTAKRTKSKVPKDPAAADLGFLDPNGSRLGVKSDANLIKWPSEHQMQEVSKRLIAISRMGAQSEERGDYFNSGDLAYQIHEIINSTGELYKKSQRLKGS
jgi:hypothetical protein